MRLLVPIIVILAGGALAFYLNLNGDLSHALDDLTEKVKTLGESPEEPVIFRVWLHEVEANPLLPDGAKWDQDGSATRPIGRTLLAENSSFRSQARSGFTDFVMVAEQPEYGFAKGIRKI
jgi:hypothetical protein